MTEEFCRLCISGGFRRVKVKNILNVNEVALSRSEGRCDKAA